MSIVTFSARKAQRLLGWDRTGSSIERTKMIISHKAFVNSRGDWDIVRSKEVSNIDYPHGSIGCDLGLRPQIFKVTIPKKKPTGWKNSLLYFKDKAGEFKLKSLKNKLSSKDVSDIVTGCLKQAGLSSRILPANPSWVTAGAKNDIYVAIGSERSLTWKALCDRLGISDYRGTFSRGGKDIWNLPLANGEKLLKIKVVDSIGDNNPSHDGNFFLHLDAAYSSIGLGRFYPVADGKIKLPFFFIGKGRYIGLKDEFFKKLTDEDVDGWTTVDNLKMLTDEDKSSLIGKTITVRMKFVKDECNPRKPKYNANMVALILGELTNRSRKWLMSKFTEQFNKIAQKIESPAENILQEIQDLLDSTADDAVAMSDKLLKYAYGLSSDHECKKIKTALLNRGRSIQIRSAYYASVIFTDEWMGKKIKIGEFLASPDLYIEISKENRRPTIVRSPIVSYQNYMKLKLKGVAPGLPHDMIIMHPDAAPHCQGDGDDHVTIFTKGLESNYTPSHGDEKFASRDKTIKYSSMSLGELYLKGTAMQAMIGSIFNLMFEHACCALDAKKSLSYTFEVFGAALDAAAQGIKKPVATPDMEHLKNIVNLAKRGKIGYFRRMSRVYLELVPSWFTKDGKYHKMPGKRENYIKGIFNVTIPQIQARSWKDMVARKLSSCNENSRSKIREFLSKYHNNPVYMIRDYMKLVLTLSGVYDIGKLKRQVRQGKNMDKFQRFVDTYAYGAYYLMSTGGFVPEVFNTIIVAASQMVIDPNDPKDSVEFKVTGYESKTDDYPVISSKDEIAENFTKSENSDILIGVANLGIVYVIHGEKDNTLDVYINGKLTGSASQQEISGVYIGKTARGNKMEVSLNDATVRFWPVN